MGVPQLRDENLKMGEWRAFFGKGCCYLPSETGKNIVVTESGDSGQRETAGDRKYFSKEFKKYFGVVPGDFTESSSTHMDLNELAKQEG